MRSELFMKFWNLIKEGFSITIQKPAYVSGIQIILRKDKLSYNNVIKDEEVHKGIYEDEVIYMLNRMQATVEESLASEGT
jgi:hypothetical protein